MLLNTFRNSSPFSNILRLNDEYAAKYIHIFNITISSVVFGGSIHVGAAAAERI